MPKLRLEIGIFETKKENIMKKKKIKEIEEQKKAKELQEKQNFNEMLRLKQRLLSGPINLFVETNAIHLKMIAKEFPEEFIIWGDSLFSSQILSLFWENELENFKFSDQNKIKLKEFVEKGVENFRKMYGFVYPSDSELKTALYFIRKVLVGYNKLVIISEEGTEFLQIPPKIPIIDEIIRLLKEYKQGLPDSVLLHRLNTSDVHYAEFNKPIKNDTFYDLLKKYDYYFDKRSIGDIKIPDWKEIIIKEKLLSKFSEIDLTKFASSNYHLIISYIFNGDKFPLETSEEYVRLRPIIFIDFYNRTESYPDYHPLKKNKFMEIIGALLFSKYGRNLTADFIEEWLENNIFISAINPYRHTMGGNIVNTTKHIDLITRELVPVLNLENNPGNLFEDSVRKALADYNTWLNSLKDSSQGINN